MHGWASPGASQVNHFHSGQPDLCTQAMANKLSVGGIFTLSMTFGASLNWDGGVCWYTAHIIKCLWPFGGDKEIHSGGDVWLALSHLRSFSEFSSYWTGTLSRPCRENRTEPSTSYSVRFIQPWHGSATCKKMSIFFSSPAVHRPHSRDVDGPALSQRLFPIAPLIR